jgi:Sulfotransferase family
MTMPNFLVIGTAKSGTTSLYNYLSQHPEIYMSPNKEPRFFVYDGEDLPPDHPIHRNTVNKFESYQALFDGVTNEKAIGEASPAYLVEPKAPVRIHHYIPDAKLIAILRNPAERAYSHFLALIKGNHESCYDFGTALKNVDKLRIGPWSVRRDYLIFGYYYANLKRYFDIFDRNQIKIFLFEDLKTDPLALLHDTFQFLEVDDTFIPDISIHYGVSGIPKSRAFHKLLSKPNSFRSLMKPFIRPIISKGLQEQIESWLIIRNLQKPKLSQEVRSYLIDIYREDILNSQELIQRDLSEWLN